MSKNYEKIKNKVLLKRYHGWIKNLDNSITINIQGIHKFVFNETSAMLWELMDEHNTIDDIVSQINEKYKVNLETLKNEICELSEELINCNLAIWERSLWLDDE